MVQTVFDLYKGKQKNFWASLQFLILNKLKNKFSFRCNHYKEKKKKILILG